MQDQCNKEKFSTRSTTQNWSNGNEIGQNSGPDVKTMYRKYIRECQRYMAFKLRDLNYEKRCLTYVQSKQIKTPLKSQQKQLQNLTEKVQQIRKEISNLRAYKKKWLKEIRKLKKNKRLGRKQAKQERRKELEHQQLNSLIRKASNERRISSNMGYSAW